ncbi:hypothetical protein Pcinc_038235 [Petrolisthes cinctipes]|uniref:Uncharacterized protein n=1 Tax=Petrolisthes cinctipes TaxID=88211 RepID=A0AAE1EKL6_PETCI|nr:hypothetical protein Pcinc_038235 [Petrolisthes cinctipes]
MGPKEVWVMREGGLKVTTKAPDGGWGWMVALGSYIMMGLLPVISLCYPIIFSRFLMERHVSTTTANWILNLHLFLDNLMGLFAGPLTKELGFRRVSVSGAILTCLCFLALVFLDSTWYLLVFYSLCGVFVGVAYKPCFLLLALYFDRRRGLANTFPMAGVCTAQLVGPPLIHYLLDEYSLRGATLILGGIFLNSVVGACLFQPVEWHLKPIQDGEVQERDTLHDTQQHHGNNKKIGEQKTYENLKRVDVSQSKKEKNLLRHNEYKRPHDCESVLLKPEQCDFLVSKIDRKNNQKIKRETTHNDDKNSQVLFVSRLRQVFKSILRVCRSVLTDLTILRSPRAMIIVAGSICSITGYANFQAMVPFAMQREGYTLADSAWCFSIVAASNFITRLVASWLSDYRWFNTRLAYMSGVAIMAVSSCVFGFLTRLVWMQVVMCVWGVGVGMVMSLYILLMPRVMGLDNMPAIYGSQSLLLGLSFIFVGPLVGVIRDASGSYCVAMVFTGVWMSVCVVMWLFMPAAEEWDRRRGGETRD